MTRGAEQDTGDIQDRGGIKPPRDNPWADDAHVGIPTSDRK